MKYLILLFFITSLHAKNFIETNVKTLNWQGIEVVWLKDEKFPTFDIMVYFGDGALSEKKEKLGQTQLMFNNISLGTTRYTQKEIVDALEFFGTSYASNVTHEYSTYSVSGLMAHLEPSLKMVCHMFQNATYPKAELKKSKKRIITGLESLVTSHSELASRAFREISLGKTMYKNPVGGKIATIKSLHSKDLKKRLNFFNNKVYKKIYIRGPKDIFKIKSIFKNDCGWKASKLTQKKLPAIKQANNSQLYLVTVPSANQAQIRIGKVLTKDQATVDQTRLAFASKYIGGGFTSRLMQEVRVKRGLTYSIGAYAAGQRYYGRSGIITFTKNKTLAQTLNVISKTIEDNSSSIEEKFFNHSKRYIKGNYIMSLESNTGFMNTLMMLDHQGRPYDELYNFTSKLEKISSHELAKKIKDIYSIKDQVIVVLGSKSLKKQLVKAGYQVKLVNYKRFL
ncbi:MAG: insulinase family protein [Bacteriovoracaceae bacterium]|jgi:zinc protease|nr:insulinase family protein [Bacteriovoracaceae bacterium]